MKTKNYEFYCQFHYWWLDCAIPLRFSIENMDKDYTEIWLQILGFNFGFTRISHKFSKEIDDMFKGGSDD